MTQTKTKTDTMKEKVIAAWVLGRQAFERGSSAAPALDRELMALLSGVQVGDGVPVLKAWIRGWTEANLAAVLA